jgi:hypothetical protein
MDYCRHELLVAAAQLVRHYLGLAWIDLVLPALILLLRQLLVERLLVLLARRLQVALRLQLQAQLLQLEQALRL